MRISHQTMAKLEIMRIFADKLLKTAQKNLTEIVMEATTINVPVRVPKSYSLALLQQQLAAYAQQLVASAKPKRRYRHEALCGIFNSDATQEELLEEYLQEKYNV